MLESDKSRVYNRNVHIFRPSHYALCRPPTAPNDGAVIPPETKLRAALREYGFAQIFDQHSYTLKADNITIFAI